MDPFIILALKFFSLLLGIAYGTTVIGRIVGCKESVSQTQMYLWALGASSFITLQWLI